MALPDFSPRVGNDPKSVLIHLTTGTGMEIEWKDGHRSVYTFAFLRDACPCETGLAMATNPDLKSLRKDSRFEALVSYARQHKISTRNPQSEGSTRRHDRGRRGSDRRSGRCVGAGKVAAHHNPGIHR